MRKPAAVLAGLALSLGCGAAVPFWGDRESSPVGTPPAALKEGSFVWTPAAAPAGPIVVVVSLAEQRAYAYRNGVRIGYATASTGKKGYETPTGVFTTLQKEAEHRSSIYDDAPMPYTQRLTWGGVALHAGGLPGYPSSHGCVHLPSAFAQLLFDASPLGMTVVVSDQAMAPEQVVHPAALAPVDAATGAPMPVPTLAPTEDFRWMPEQSPAGPVSILISGADRRILVLRNGIEIGHARVGIRDPEVPLGSHVFTVVEDWSPAPDDATAGRIVRQWVAVGLPGYAGEDPEPLEPTHSGRIAIPPGFIAVLRPLLVPGTTLMITDAGALPQTTGVDMTVISNTPPDRP